MTTLEGNKLIAEFLDSEIIICADGTAYKPFDFCGFISLDDLCFHSSWDWLMPVAKKCNELTVAGISHSFDITEQWNIVVSFIQWYNSQSKTDNNKHKNEKK